MTPLEHKKKMQAAAEALAREADFNRRLFREVTVIAGALSILMGVLACRGHSMVFAFVSGGMAWMSVHSIFKSRRMWNEWMTTRDRALDTAQLLDKLIDTHE